MELTSFIEVIKCLQILKLINFTFALQHLSYANQFILFTQLPALLLKAICALVQDKCASPKLEDDGRGLSWPN
jgi:hypothetical protein